MGSDGAMNAMSGAQPMVADSVVATAAPGAGESPLVAGRDFTRADLESAVGVPLDRNLSQP